MGQLRLLKLLIAGFKNISRRFIFLTFKRGVCKDVKKKKKEEDEGRLGGKEGGV